MNCCNLKYKINKIVIIYKNYTVLYLIIKYYYIFIIILILSIKKYKPIIK